MRKPWKRFPLDTVSPQSGGGYCRGVRTIGFTGTKLGMTPPQRAEVQRILESARKRGAVEFVFGLCVGADEEAALDAAALGYRLRGFPAFELGDPNRSLLTVAFLHPVAAPLDRNGSIVEFSKEIVAAPHGYREVQRSGTWATIRRARRLGRPVSIVAPDGSLLDG